MHDEESRVVRIAVLAPPWVPIPPPAYGGTEAVLDGLARGLQTAGHDVLLFTTGDSTCPVPTRWSVPRAIGIGNAGTVAELSHAVAGYAAADEWGADIIHDHTGIGALFGVEATTTPIVVTNHGPFDGELAAYHRVVTRRVPVIAISQQHARGGAGLPIVAVIHHGIDVDRFEPGPGDGGYALFLGRMCADKGVREAILTARAAEVPLKIAAKMREPDELEYFEQQVRPLLGDDAEYLGEVTGPEKVELLRRATCLLNPITWPEPFGMVMIESLACGTPVVATPLGSVRELIDDGVTGIVRPRGRLLVNAVRQVGKLSRAACRAAAVERFSVERMVADHLAVYERVINEAPRYERSTAS